MLRALALRRAGLLALSLLTASPALASWIPGGNPLSGPSYSYNPDTAPDGLGGVLIVHDDGTRPCLSHRDGDGVQPPCWSPDPLVPSGPTYLPPHGAASHVISDANGGAYVVSA